jgi:hypothetical protein
VAGDGAAELQTAIYGVLNADTPLSNLGASVYDFVPKGAALPYVTVGDDTLTWDGTMGVDWFNVTATIHSWAYGEGHLSVKPIMSAVYDALHKVGLTVSGKTHVETLLEFSDVFPEDDGIYHGVQRFRVIIHDPFS